MSCERAQTSTVGDGIWRPEYHNGRGNFAPGWFAHRTQYVGELLQCSSTGGPLGLHPFASEAECLAWCAEQNGQTACALTVVDGGKDADSYKLNPGGHRS